MFGLSRIEAYIIAGAFAVVLMGGIVTYLIHYGATNERNANAAEVLKESESDRKLREGNDTNARSLDDQRALACLRHPEGCRR